LFKRKHMFFGLHGINAGPNMVLAASNPKSIFVRYFTAVAAACLGLLLRFLLTPLIGSEAPYFTAWLAVVFCALFCGVGPSVVATILTVLGVWYWFLPVYGSFALRSTHEAVGLGVFLLLAGIIIAIGQRARRTRAEMEDAVRERTAELGLITTRMLQLQDAERRRFARDLHDSIGQLLAIISMNLAAFEKEKLSANGSRLLTDNKQLVEQLSREVRTISHLLHPPMLDEAGLGVALRIYAEGFSKRSNIMVDVQVPEELPRLSEELEISVFRIVQESLTNVHKHAEAKSVKICIDRSSTALTVRVEDDGKGLPKDHVLGVGLTGMQERVRQLRGNFQVSSSMSGTAIIATIPTSDLAQRDSTTVGPDSSRFV
jgi:signal transduction histidine kinase